MKKIMLLSGVSLLAATMASGASAQILVKTAPTCVNGSGNYTVQFSQSFANDNVYFGGADQSGYTHQPNGALKGAFSLGSGYAVELSVNSQYAAFYKFDTSKTASCQFDVVKTPAGYYVYQGDQQLQPV